MADKYYPSFDHEVKASIKDGILKAFEYIYQLKDQLGPLSICVSGTEDTVVDVADIAVKNCSITIPRTGKWLVSGVFSFDILASDGAQVFSGKLRSQTTVIPTATLMGAVGTRATVTQQWLIGAVKGETLTLLVVKGGGGGASVVHGADTTISATWAGQ